MNSRRADDLAKIFTGSPVPPQISVELHGSEVSDVAEELPSSPGTPDQHTLASNHSVLTHSASPTPPLENPHASADELEKIGGFTIEQMGVDRRLLVNRKRQLKMYRVWMQAKFSKRVP
jgi:tRNAThr (cytosine32-N3)-methyltransferase